MRILTFMVILMGILIVAGTGIIGHELYTRSTQLDTENASSDTQTAPSIDWPFPLKRNTAIKMMSHTKGQTALIIQEVEARDTVQNLYIIDSTTQTVLSKQRLR